MGTITKLYARGIDTTTAKLSWTDAGCDEYIIYRLRNGKYVQIATTKNTYYYDKSLVSFGAFYYKVKGVVYTKDGTAHTTKLTNTAYAITKGVTPTLKLATKRNANTLTWSKVPRAGGYKIYRQDNWSGEWKLVKKITNGTTVTFTDRTVSNDRNYGYKVVAYRIIKNKAYYTPYSEVRNSTEYVSVLNAAELKNRIYEFKIENVQSNKSTFTTCTLSQKDREILSKFAREHFTSDMTRYDKLYTTLNWINKNVDYIQDQSGWNKIAGMSYVEAIFVQKTGQCAQYNGAMASMMSYMGYDVTLIHGWRGNWSNGNYWQHFWVEAHIGGIDYVVETGNYGSSGNWMYMPTPYKYTSGYIKNCKNL
ncbi:MAG: hypothetical protein IJZ51_08700 [Ruminiclostridium sp.]|nr:hypothetical protein [Ruminiclostridium sp.]